jgi:hypothetical protein
VARTFYDPAGCNQDNLTWIPDVESTIAVWSLLTFRFEGVTVDISPVPHDGSADPPHWRRDWVRRTTDRFYKAGH